MYTLTPSLQQRFGLYLNVLPVVEKCAMYICFAIGAILILMTTYIVTFKIMFKSYDGKSRKCNFNFKSRHWLEQEKGRKNSIYAPCEIPLTDSDSSDPCIQEKQIQGTIQELGHLLSDKVQESIDSVKGVFRSDSTQIKGSRKDSLIDDTDSAESNANSASENECEYRFGDCKYLEVVDDGFDESSAMLPDDEESRTPELHIHIG